VIRWLIMLETGYVVCVRPRAPVSRGLQVDLAAAAAAALDVDPDDARATWPAPGLGRRWGTGPGVEPVVAPVDQGLAVMTWNADLSVRAVAMGTGDLLGAAHQELVQDRDAQSCCCMTWAAAVGSNFT
jgi:hypothetical protein